MVVVFPYGYFEYFEWQGRYTDNWFLIENSCHFLDQKSIISCISCSFMFSFSVALNQCQITFHLAAVAVVFNWSAFSWGFSNSSYPSSFRYLASLHFVNNQHISCTRGFQAWSAKVFCAAASHSAWLYGACWCAYVKEGLWPISKQVLETLFCFFWYILKTNCMY